MNDERDPAAEALFSLGQVVNHKLFHYRGVIIDADPCFQGSEEWYRSVARTQPPKDQPWYRVLVHNSVQETYVAERNLESDCSGEPVNHPLLEIHFRGFEAGRYLNSERLN